MKLKIKRPHPISAIKRVWRAIAGYFVALYLDMRRVTWPTLPQIGQYTAVVVITTVVTTLIMTAYDYGMGKLVTDHLIR